MKIAVIPDIHGNWKGAIENIKKYKDKVDKIITLGDYVDDFEESLNGLNMITGFKQLCEMKREEPEKFTLLLGNHDLGYMGADRCSGFHWQYSIDYREMFYKNIDILDIATKEGDWVFSHAGITSTWMKRWILDCEPNEKTGDYYNVISADDWNSMNEIEKINKLFHCGKMDFLCYEQCTDYSDHWGTGNENSQCPVWVRPEALLRDAYYKKQIVGHTESKDPPVEIIEEDKDIILTDSRDHNLVYELSF